MKRAIHRFLQDEERASNIVIWGCAAVGGVCFLLALAAIALLQ